MWVSGIKSLPLSGPEPYAAIESYHLRLKSKIFSEQHVDSWSRVDWLISMLTTKVHSIYWLDQFSMETGYFDDMRDKSFATNAWNQALQITDVDVIMDEQNIQLAKVLSQTDKSLAYTIWNPGSEFALCDCSWSIVGNLCEHVIKVAILYKTRKAPRPLLAAEVYQQTLLNLLQNPPDDPVVLDRANMHLTRIHQDIKELEELSNNGLLRPLPSEISSQMTYNMVFSHLH